MLTKSERIQAMQQLIDDVEQYRQLDEARWTMPLAEGKWSIRDCVSHIFLWDKYFYEAAIEPISLQQPITLENLSFEQFNRDAAEQGSKMSQDEIINSTVHYRTKIIQALELIPEDTYTTDYGKFTIESYFEDFADHDRHHMRQIDRALQ